MVRSDFDKQIKECMAKHLEQVNNDKWRSKYHIIPPIGWINDPNGYVNLMENITVIINTHH